VPKIIQTEVFTFAELQAAVTEAKTPDSKKRAKAAVEKALDWLREGACNGNFWFEYTYELWKSALNQIGFDDPDISFSGFSCQGDGASFSCKRLDIEKLVQFLACDVEPTDCVGSLPGGKEGEEDFRGWLLKQIGWKEAKDPKYLRLARVAYDLDSSVTRIDQHYVHWNTCRVYIVCNSGRQTRCIDKLVASLEEDAEELRKSLCKAIYKSLNDEYDYLTSDEALAENAEANEYTFTSCGRRFG